MSTSAREKMIRGAAQLLSRAGVGEASFGNVVALTGAPRGSIYHHFPGGKDQLLSESVRYVGARLIGALRTSDVDTPADVVLLFAGLFRRLLVESDGGAGCAVAAVAVETPRATPPAEAADAVFRSWIDELRTLFERAGVDPAESRGLATATVAGVEGALVLGRATGDVAIFDEVVERLAGQVPASGPAVP